MASPERDSFERLYRRHVGDVYRFILAVVRNPTEAEDVTQTTFLNAYRALERGHEPQRVHSWLIAIAHNAIRSRHRWSLRRPKEVPLDEALHGLAVPDEDRATVREVLELLGELPETQRTAIALRELDGRSYPEIAATMGVTVPAVESLIARARRTLRQKHSSLRGVAGIPLPRSLRTFLQQGDAPGTSFAVKAAVVVAAAGAFAGGAAVTSRDAGASKKPSRAAMPEPSRVLVTPTVRVRARATHAVPQKHAAAASSSASAPPPAHADPPAVTPLPSASPGGDPTPPPDHAGPSNGTTTTTTTTGTTPAVGTVAYRPPSTPTLPTLPSAPTSLDPSTWETPTLPQLPQPPALPQVPAVSGIN